MSENKNQREEEVDLGSLFIIIGRGVSKFFNFIGNIFKEIYHFLILVLIFLRVNIIKFAIAGILGASLGGYFQITKLDKYASTLIVSPNFGSSKQLYTTVFYFNDLIKQEDYVELSRIFKITEEEATNLLKFDMEALPDSRDIAVKYDKMVNELDTLVIKKYPFDDFREAFTDYDYKNHIIYIESLDRNIFSKLRDPIISSINENDFFVSLKENRTLSYRRTDSLLRNELLQIDSLRKVYNTVLIENSKKDFQGTNIDLASKNETSSEIELFQKNSVIDAKLKALTEEKTLNKNIINVVSELKPVGYKIRGLEKNFAFLGFVVSLGLMLAFLLLKDLNKYLENYKK